MGKFKIDYTQIPELGVYAKHLDHYGKMAKLLQAHETKAKSIHFRKNAIHRQQVANYQNEYDRIRGALTRTILHDCISRASLLKRQYDLQKLGAKAIDGIADI